MLIASLMAMVLLINLGLWQWGRGDEKQQMNLAAESALEAPPVVSRNITALDEYTKVQIDPESVSDKHFLLDNQVSQQRPGFLVLMPLQYQGKWYLVDRGWVPMMADRSIKTPLEPQEFAMFEALVNRPSKGFLLGDATADQLNTGWPKVVQTYDFEALSKALEVDLQPIVLRPVKEYLWTFERIWKPTGGEPSKHYAYAMQWFGFATALLGMVLFFGLKRNR
ncbi:MAG: SURF1 family protein [Gammaproteobacteria bacterium]|nr:SURF1 family protein [Gammaproteobacteria bacterium]